MALDKKALAVADKEERIARLHYQIAQGKKKLLSLEYEKQEIGMSIPQWEEEIEKEKSEIDQINNSK